MTTIEKWMSEPFVKFHEHHHRYDDTFHMLQHACHYIQGREHVIKIVGAEWEEEKLEKEIAQARRNAKIAKSENSSGYPILHTQMTTFLWGSLEALLLDFFSLWLAKMPNIHQNHEIKDLKITFGDFESLSDLDKGEYLLDKLEDKVGSRRLGGINRFERIFQVLNLQSKIDKTLERDLLELNGIRNLFIHKRGIIDARFKSRCPWLELQIGDQYVVSHDDYHRYFDAIDLYVFEITQRILIFHGRPRSGHKPTCRFYECED